MLDQLAIVGGKWHKVQFLDLPNQDEKLDKLMRKRLFWEEKIELIESNSPDGEEWKYYFAKIITLLPEDLSDRVSKLIDVQKYFYADKQKISGKKFRERNKDYFERYRKSNKDYIKMRRKQYYGLHKDYIIKRTKQYYELNKERIKNQQKRYYELHKNNVLNCKKRYYNLHKDEITKYNKRYRELHRDPTLNRKKQGTDFEGD